MRSISELKDKHNGDIYVCGSGKSIDFIPKSFWEGRVIVGANRAFKFIPVTYGITHHHFVVPEMIEAGITAVTSERDVCYYNGHPHDFKGDYYFYKHKPQAFTKLDFSIYDNPEYLVCGGTIMTAAICFAHHLGAKNIFLVGVDGGLIDGDVNYDGYYPTTPIQHLITVQPQIDEQANYLRKRGVGVFSINPFTNFKLENHQYSI